MAHEHFEEHSHNHEKEHGCEHCNIHSHSKEHSHSHEEESELTLKQIIIAVVLFVAALCIEHIGAVKSFLENFGLISGNYLWKWISIVLFFVSYILSGKNVLKSALKNISKGKIFDEQFLMSVASIGAIFVGEIGEAVAVMLFYDIGEFFQDYAVDKSRKSISSLMEIKADKANVLRDGKFVEERAENIKIGDIIELKPGERCALDGKIVKGESFMDTSALTGESVPRKLSVGQEVLSGFVNQDGVLEIQVQKLLEDSAVSRILKLTQEASDVKTKSEKFISRFASVYTPIVCILALAVAFLPPLALKLFSPELFVQYGFKVWIYRALTFLVVSCPCALVISVPLSFFCGIGAASKKGVLIKGSNFIEALSKAETAVFDKTGTLTKGVFYVKQILPVQGFSKDELLALASHAEFFSNHPISKSLKTAHGKCEKCDLLKNENFMEIAGHGLSTILDGKTVLVGNKKLLENQNIQISEEILNSISESGTQIFVAEKNEFKGVIIIGDEVKEDSKTAIKHLKQLGIKKTVMLSGDKKESADFIAKELNLDEVYGELLPDQKVQKVEELISKNSKNKKLLFVGDGINDSPVLARSDVGISMGALGSDAAIEASDVVIMDDKISHLVDAIKISKKTMKIVYQNIIVSIAIKVLIMAAGTLGFANMWVAVFGDVGVSFLAVLNSMRILKIK